MSRRPLDAERVVCVSDAAYSDAEEMAAVLGLAGGAAAGDRVEPLVIDANVTMPPWVDVRCVSVVHMYVCMYVCVCVCVCMCVCVCVCGQPGPRWWRCPSRCRGRRSCAR